MRKAKGHIRSLPQYRQQIVDNKKIKSAESHYSVGKGIEEYDMLNPENEFEAARAKLQAKKWVADQIAEGASINHLVKIVIFTPEDTEKPYNNLVEQEKRRILVKLLRKLK